jgi:hypothetical protein
MKKLIIVKYAEHIYPDGKAPLRASETAYPYSYTAEKCGLTNPYFTDNEEAILALEKMVKFNPTVGYGIVEAIEDINVNE